MNLIKMWYNNVSKENIMFLHINMYEIQQNWTKDVHSNVAKWMVGWVNEWMSTLINEFYYDVIQ